MVNYLKFHLMIIKSKNYIQYFFDTTLILDILVNEPHSLHFISTDLSETLIENIPSGIKPITSKIIDVVWIFTQIRSRPQVTQQKSKDYPISIHIPEKQYPPGSNQQFIELNRLLTCYKQRITDLESSWTHRMDFSYYLPIQNNLLKLTLSDMEWLSFSNYGKITGLNKYYKQFKSIDDMIKQLYHKKSDDQLRQLQSQIDDQYLRSLKNKKYSVDNLHQSQSQNGRLLYTHEKYNDDSMQHIQDWLIKNNFQFDEIKSAEYRLNEWIEKNELELFNVEFNIHDNQHMHQYIAAYSLS